MTLKKTLKTPLPEGVESLDAIARRYFSQKERAGMNSEDFGDPEKRAYPVHTQQDLDNAAHLIGHADNPDAVKTRLKTIAKRKGLSLPKDWQDEESKAPASRAIQPDEDGRAADELLDDLTGNDPPDEGDDHQELIDDLDGVDGDNEPRNVAGATIERSMPATDVSYYAPITRIDKEKREIIGTATAEVKDAYRTVIGYEASKDAFARWRGNIREMHQSKAVGRALEITPDDERRRIIVRARISKGAQDTWEKILDGTLTGFSIGGKNGKWTRRVIDGEEIDYLERYDQAELSVVDNPACPAANIEVVRADGIASDVLAKDEEMDPKTTPKASESDVERKSVRISAETRDALHTARDHALNAAKQTMTTCGCDDCMAKMNKVAENDDNDGDMDSPAAMRHAIAEIVRTEIGSVLQSQIAPTMQRVNALLANDAQRSENPDITRRVDDMHEQLVAIKEIVEKIAAQPLDGGPILHGGGAPMEKRLATQGNPSRTTDPDVIRRAMELGFAPPSDPQEQIRAASKLFQPIHR